MTVYSLYIFDRKGTCLFSEQWKRHRESATPEEDIKLLYGLIFSLKAFVTRLSPVPSRHGFRYYKTATYKLNFLETLSGLKLVMMTDLGVEDITGELHAIYRKIYVEYAIKNPLYTQGEPITSDLFREQLDRFVQALPFFK